MPTACQRPREISTRGPPSHSFGETTSEELFTLLRRRPDRPASHGDDDLSSSVTLCYVSERLRALAQRVCLVDDGCDLS